MDRNGRMILHFYTAESPLTYTRIHNGLGLGSIFARLFGKIASKAAAKTALKAAVSAAKTVGKKALKTAVKEAVPLAKEGIKQGVSEAAKFGTEKAIHGIRSLAETAISKGAPADIIHKVSTTAEKGLQKQANQIVKTATEKLQAGIDKAVDFKPKKRKAQKHSTKSKKKKTSLHQNLFDAL